MKKKILLTLLLIIMLLSIVVGGVLLNDNITKTSENNVGIYGDSDLNSGSSKVGKNAIILTDKLFLPQLDDIYYNSGEYVGKIVQYEGFIYNIPDTNNMVVARDFYCCGFDSSLVGLECIGSEEKFENDEWVTVTGKIVLSDKYEYVTPVLEVISLVRSKEGERIVGY